MAVSGDLRDMDLSSIISINCNEMNQARLLVQHHGRKASIYFEDGNIVHMSLGAVEGEEVMREIVGWKEGRFDLEQGVAAPRRTVTTGWSALLLEGMRRLDEATAVASSRKGGSLVSEEEGPGLETGSVNVRCGVEGARMTAKSDVGEGEPEDALGVESIQAATGSTPSEAGPWNLRTMATSLFQMGLHCGLSPDEAALQVSETRLPAFVTDEDQEEFKECLVDAYRESLTERVKELRRAMGFGGDQAPD
jgi:hypothetical protein